MRVLLAACVSLTAAGSASEAVLAGPSLRAGAPHRAGTLTGTLTGTPMGVSAGPSASAEEWTELRPAHPVLDERRVQAITKLSAQLLDLDASELDVAAAAHRAEREFDVVLAIVLRAGRPVPPGLSAARRAQRETRADEALDWISREIETDGGLDRIEDALGLVLSASDPRLPPVPEFRIAAARVVAELDLVELAPHVAALLAETESPDVRRGAMAALYGLYARWFTSPDEFRTRWEPLRGLAPSATGRDELQAANEIANDRALQLIEFARFDGDPLDWPDRGMAARAARAVGRAVAGNAMDPSDARALLLDGIADVGDPFELHGRLGVVLDLVQGADPAGDVATGVRAAVIEVARRSNAKGPSTVWVAVGSLPRLPFPEGPEGDAVRGEVFSAGLDAFRRALGARRQRPVDPDALQGAIFALRDLALSIEDADRRARVAAPFGDVLQALVLDATVAMGIRRAAASSLVPSSEAETASVLIGLIRGVDDPELDYELFGALESVLASVPADGAEVDEASKIVTELFETLAQPDFDRRARALDLLLSDGLQAALLRAPRKEEARRCVERLGTETSAELRVRMLALLERIGDAEVVELAMAEPGLIEGLTDSGPEVAQALASTFDALLGEDPGRSRVEFDLAQRMAGDLGVTGALDPDRVHALRTALDLVFGFDDAVAESLSRDAHRWTLRAAIDLRRAAPVLVPAQLDAHALTRLLEVHAPGLAAPVGEREAAGDDLALLSLARAVFGADQVLAELASLEPDAVEPAETRATRARLTDGAVEGYDAAVAKGAVAEALGLSVRELRLECVEFLRATGRTTAAQTRLAVLLDELEPPTSGEDPADIRELAELTRDTVASRTDAQASSLAARAVDAMLALATDAPWSDGDGATQLRDLTLIAALVERAEVGEARSNALAFLVEQCAGAESDGSESHAQMAEADPAEFSALLEAIARLSGGEAGSGDGDAR